MRIALMSSCRSVPEIDRADAGALFEMHGGNLGNVAFVNAIWSHLRSPVTPVSWHASAEELRSKADIVVIACANQLGSHTDLGRVADNLERAGLPLLALGLGAQSDSQSRDVELTPGTRRWLEVIARSRTGRSANIGVRGDYTLRQLERLGLQDSAVTVGCPSNFTNLAQDYVESVEARSRLPVSLVAAAIGQPHTPQLASIERQIVELVSQTGGTAIVQHGLLMIRLAQREFGAVEDRLLEQTRRYFRPNLTIEAFKQWCSRTLVAFGDANQWMHWLRRYDFVVGPRFHGVMLAIQAGVPAGCVAYDSRTLELCQTTGVPVRAWNDIPEPLTLDNLNLLFPFHGEAYRATRARMVQRYVAMLQDAGVEVAPGLKALASPTPARHGVQGGAVCPQSMRTGT